MIYPCRPIPCRPIPAPLSLSIWSINHRAHRWEALGNLRSIRDVTTAGSDSFKLNPELFCLFVPTIGVKLSSEHDLFRTSDISPWKWRSLAIRRLEDPPWILFFLGFFTIRGLVYLDLTHWLSFPLRSGCFFPFIFILPRTIPYRVLNSEYWIIRKKQCGCDLI